MKFKSNFKNSPFFSLIKIGILLGFFVPFVSCSSMLCSKGDTNQGILFDYDPLFQTVDIGPYPTAHIRDSWVKKLIVREAGFLLVYGQKSVHCDNYEEMKKNYHTPCEGHKLVENYTIIRYHDNTGYEEWSYAPKEDWQNVENIEHVFEKKPDYHYENCRFQLFGGLIKLIQMIIRI